MEFASPTTPDHAPPPQPEPEPSNAQPIGFVVPEYESSRAFTDETFGPGPADGGGTMDKISRWVGNLAGVPQEHHRKINVCLLGASGSILEWFDFAVFAYFADDFSEAFFPGEDEILSLMKTFAVFWIAFFFRPIGGVLFGAMGDKMGRKPAVLTAIFTMAASTTLMGCLPTYDQVGALAPVCLIIARALQGLSVGGQLVGTFAFSVESAPEGHKCLFGCLVGAGAGFGFTLGSAFATLLNDALTEEQMQSFGWRIPFWFGASAGLAAYFAKDHVEESDEGKALAAEAEASGDAAPRPSPTIEAIRLFWREILLVAGVMSFGANGGYMASVWLVNYAIDMVKPAIPHAHALTTINLLFGTPIQIWAALQADKAEVGYTFIITLGSATFLFLLIPAFGLISGGTPAGYMVGQGVLMASNSMFFAPIAVWMVQTFTDPRCRYSAMGIGYNLAQCFFGGTAPLLSTFLVNSWGIPALIIYNMMLCIVAIVCVTISEKRRAAQA